jgi:hypothetical protein
LLFTPKFAKFYKDSGCIALIASEKNYRRKKENAFFNKQDKIDCDNRFSSIDGFCYINGNASPSSSTKTST